MVRGIINAFKHFGGVPDELLFDNMTTVANINAKPKKPTDAITSMAKDCDFKVRLIMQNQGSVDQRHCGINKSGHEYNHKLGKTDVTCSTFLQRKRVFEAPSR